jgi:hypothetical protein
MTALLLKGAENHKMAFNLLHSNIFIAQCDPIETNGFRDSRKDSIIFIACSRGTYACIFAQPFTGDVPYHA